MGNQREKKTEDEMETGGFFGELLTLAGYEGMEKTMEATQWVI